MTKLNWTWNDPAHIDAHAADFLESPAAALESVHDLIAAKRPADDVVRRAAESGEELWLHMDIELEKPVGWTGLANTCEEDIESFWGYRIGRSLPSHLCVAEKELTKWLCVWGMWLPDTLRVHTIYPGRRAPREIHDRSLTMDELPKAIEFWRCHAIVVGEGEFTLTPGG